MNERVYRPIQLSDLPKIQSGKLKAFWWDSGLDYKPASLISTKYGADRRVAFLVTHSFGDGVELVNIVIDVTPEKRYAIWNHQANRFTDYTYKEKTEAQITVDELNTGRSLKNYYLVEFDYPGESN